MARPLYRPTAPKFNPGLPPTTPRPEVEMLACRMCRGRKLRIVLRRPLSSVRKTLPHPGGSCPPHGSRRRLFQGEVLRTQQVPRIPSQSDRGKIHRLDRGPMKAPLQLLCRQSPVVPKTVQPTERGPLAPAADHRSSGIAQAHWYRVRSPNACPFGNGAIHLLKGHRRPFVPEGSEQPREGSDGHDSHFIVVEDDVAHTVSRHHAERLADRLGQGGLPP